MAEKDRLAGRNGEIWRKYCQGWTQERLADEYGLDRSRVSQILKQVRDSIPEQTRLELVSREADFLDRLRDEVAELFHAPLPPAFDRDGGPLVDPSTGEIVRDSTPRINALTGLLKVMDRHSKLLGLDAPSRLEATVTQDEDSAAKALAAAAAARLAGEKVDPGTG